MASLRGLPHPDAEATRLLTLFGLTQQQHVLAGTLNAPCGRKLSVALATIGSPSVLILDAPTYCAWARAALVYDVGWVVWSSQTTLS